MTKTKNEVTLNETIREHRKMWRWIAKESQRTKTCVTKKEYVNKKHIYDIPKFNALDLYADCFCCYYSEPISSENNKCENCPFDWHSKANRYMCRDIETDDEKGIYMQWCMACLNDDYVEASRLAKQIAMLKKSNKGRYQ